MNYTSLNSWYDEHILRHGGPPWQPRSLCVRFEPHMDAATVPVTALTLECDLRHRALSPPDGHWAAGRQLCKRMNETCSKF